MTAIERRDRQREPLPPLHATKTSDVSRELEFSRAEPMTQWIEVEASATVFRQARLHPPVIRSAEGKALSTAADRIQAELQAVKQTAEQIRDRQQVLAGAKATITQQTVPAIRDLIDAARTSIAVAELADDPEQRALLLREATSRLQAALIMTQLEKIEVAYLEVADAAEDRGCPSAFTTGVLRAMNEALAPLAEAALSLDPARMNAALEAHGADLEHAASFLGEWVTRLDSGWALSQKTIAAADAAMIVLSIYQIARAAPSMAGGGDVGISGVSASGAAVGARTLVTAELLESVRKLIEIGALANVVVSGGPVAVGPISPPAPMEMRTPSGTIVPAAGPFEGRRVSYGDPRNKHTDIAEHTLAQLLSWLKNPKKAPKRVRNFIAAIARKDTDHGSQLSREGVAQYEKLVREALEKGRFERGKFIHHAASDIGIDVTTGRPTRYYRVDGAPHGAHIVPEVPK